MARTTKTKTEMNRAAIYARVSDKSQDGEDKTSISEQIERWKPTVRAWADHYRLLPGGGQGLVQEAPRVPEDAG